MYFFNPICQMFYYHYLVFSFGAHFGGVAVDGERKCEKRRHSLSEKWEITKLGRNA